MILSWVEKNNMLRQIRTRISVLQKELINV